MADQASVRLRALTDLARGLARVHGFSEVISVAAEESRKALDARVVSLSEFVRATGQLRVLINHGDLLPFEERFPEEEWYAPSDFPRIVSEEYPRPWTLRSDDAKADPRRTASLRLRERNSALIAPIFFAGQVWGELYAARTADQEPYTDADLDFAATLAALVSAGLAQADRQEYLERLAYTDELTGLANRRAIEVGLDEAMELHRLTGLPVGLIICDVNGLKQVNDTSGHDTGDAVLEQLAGHLSAVAGTVNGALAARIGGDEFAVLAVGQPWSAVTQLAEDLAARAAKLEGIAGAAVGYSATDGPAGPVADRDTLFRLADAAQYEAKREGIQRPIAAAARHLIRVREAAADGTAASRDRRRIRRGR
ncbi:diguanylate cyclase [Catenulispora sp. NF23]|uniref:Diguanylate cyclase n=1 Tax=Catenulispora pinistramenti TaxID=2705254 RepID=A0ABS5KZH9_9ACTN|nr:diguanylate cyclase [Catenulispora pinistramenti]MBS2535048.1 diguanylate cyclase [Catenulispora pinistramenti]MBS2551486.1 diguanylate cyclase [Catenulispora pinistramenti]